MYWQVSAYCYNGECRTHQSQCRLWFGDKVNNTIIDKSADDCYTEYNVEGRSGGNCGYDHKTKTYLKCSPRYAVGILPVKYMLRAIDGFALSMNGALNSNYR